MSTYERTTQTNAAAIRFDVLCPKKQEKKTRQPTNERNEKRMKDRNEERKKEGNNTQQTIRIPKRIHLHVCFHTDARRIHMSAVVPYVRIYIYSHLPVHSVTAVAAVSHSHSLDSFRVCRAWIQFFFLVCTEYVYVFFLSFVLLVVVWNVCCCCRFFFSLYRLPLFGISYSAPI